MSQLKHTMRIFIDLIIDTDAIIYLYARHGRSRKGVSAQERFDP
jgi:hypothetical protein